MSNGELWIDANGSITLRPHRATSEQTNCLDVAYDPARNEAGEIAACLGAIAAQEAARGATLIGCIGVVCLINDTSDATFEIACTEAARLFDVAMPRRAANAGGARRAAMDLAAKWLEEGCHKDGFLFTTDADSLPQPDWVFAAQCAFSRDADCVAGPIDLYADDVLSLPLHVRERGALEARYDALLTELFARLELRRQSPETHLAKSARAECAERNLRCSPSW